jgi:hypothetical protein
MRLFLLFVILISLAAASLSADKPVNYTMNFSSGLRDGDAVYFLLEYKVWKARSPIWFIMPIELPPKIYFHKIFLYRYMPKADRLERLAVVREEFPPAVGVQASKFTKDGNAVVFAYPAGYDKEQRPLFEVRSWDTAASKFREQGTDSVVTRDSSLHQRYFGNYKSPYDSNPGVIGITELKKVILKDVTPEQWDLPRKW